MIVEWWELVQNVTKQYLRRYRLGHFCPRPNPQVAGIKGELNYFFLFSKLVRYGMADLSSLSVLPFTGLKSGFLLLVELSSWFGTHHWLCIGCLSLLQTSMKAFPVFWWVSPCSVFGMLLHMCCIFIPKWQQMHFSELSQCWWCEAGTPYYWSIF